MDASKYLEWVSLAKLLQATKAKEMKLRKELAAEALGPVALPAKKTVTFLELGIEFRIKGNIAYNLDEALINQFYNELGENEKASLKFSPTLKLRQYKKLPEHSLLHEAVTTKPSAPTIKVVEVKED